MCIPKGISHTYRIRVKPDIQSSLSFKMASKFVEYQQLIENWDHDTIQKLVIFTRKLKAKKGEDPAVPDIYKSITSVCKNVVEFYPFIYKVLYQFTESQEELQKRLTIQKELLSESRKCYLLMDALSKVVPNNIEIQDFIFNMGKHGVFLHKIKTNLAEDVKQKDGEIEELKEANNNLQNDLEAKSDEINQIKADLGEDVKQKDGEIDNLNEIIKRKDDEFRTLEQAKKKLGTENAKLTQEAEKLQETINDKIKLIENEQRKFSTWKRCNFQTARAIKKQFEDKHKEQLDKISVTFEDVIKNRANKMIEDSREDILRNLSQFKPDIQLQKPNLKDATFLKDLSNLDLKKISDKSTKRKENTILPVTSKKKRTI